MSETSTHRVLMVEDESLLLEVITADLEDAGFTVTSAANAENAITLLREGLAVDLLFTDIRLPGAMDGWQLAEAARRLRPGLPVIYATGFTTTPPRLIEGSMFFTKPYRASAIIRAIRTLAEGTAA
ncbi:response regulator receiver protein [Methylobacterium sp. Leaf399]|uniref:response regulator n=1 Tax=unclassified Methylobacterium TaxID=2615210 RepID=UPI0006FB2791|nr:MULTISPECIES: response regulator [unclassified Methylobacterium]KQP55232.1 response regulator receiver protein [Methylobacterium sp. Leaf108]KQT09972.1 response regulator receiver protein [Methylobacterium sp. Leaf399]KQT87586.1 response regulator receiver protein [Methylobacterium sp. Leaf466]